jgi:HEPN domain-containing protein
MPPQGPKRATPEAEALLRAAAGDWKTVELLLQHGDAPVSSVGFHAQQYLEKVMKAVLLDRSSKTPSEKILRSTMCSTAHGESYRIPSAMHDLAILVEKAEPVQGIGYSDRQQSPALTSLVLFGRSVE